MTEDKTDSWMSHSCYFAFSSIRLTKEIIIHTTQDRMGWHWQCFLHFEINTGKQRPWTLRKALNLDQKHTLNEYILDVKRITSFGERGAGHVGWHLTTHSHQPHTRTFLITLDPPFSICSKWWNKCHKDKQLIQNKTAKKLKRRNSNPGPSILSPELSRQHLLTIYFAPFCQVLCKDLRIQFSEGADLLVGETDDIQRTNLFLKLHFVYQLHDGAEAWAVINTEVRPLLVRVQGRFCRHCGIEVSTKDQKKLLVQSRRKDIRSRKENKVQGYKNRNEANVLDRGTRGSVSCRGLQRREWGQII